MKKQIYFYITFISLLFIIQGCQDFEEIETPDFNVIIPTQVKVGEPVNFKIENAPNFVKFYAGDLNHKYIYRDRFNAEGTVTMSFLAAQNYQNGTSLSNPGLSILYSTDYNGSSTPTSVTAANWTDISDKFTLPTLRTYNWTDSGVADITELTSEKKPVHIAFKVKSDGKISDGNRQGEYRMNNFRIQLTLADGGNVLDIANIESTNWQTVNVLGDNSDTNKDQWLYWTNDFFRMNGTSADYSNEDWLITSSIDLTKVSPDNGTPLKAYSDKLETFSYTYTKAGIYTITFIGNNTTVYDSKQLIKEYTITVVN